MNFIKGFAITLAFILLCIVILVVAGIIGLYLFAHFGSLFAFFVPVAIAFILIWAVQGGFIFGMARKAIHHDDQ